MKRFSFEGYGPHVIPGSVKKAIFQLRYQVYCLEWGFEKVEDHPEGLECDAFDPFSLQFVARIEGSQPSEIIGTSRIILGSLTTVFPIEAHCHFFPVFSPPPRSTTGEISRLAVSKEFRRRAIDKMMFSHGDSPEEVLDENHLTPDAHDRRRSENEIVAGIYMQLYAESKQRGITHWYAVMARGLYLLLKRWGVVFHPIGPEVNYHGWRGPYLAEIAEIEEALERKNPNLIHGARHILNEKIS